MGGEEESTIRRAVVKRLLDASIRCVSTSPLGGINFISVVSLIFGSFDEERERINDGLYSVVVECTVVETYVSRGDASRSAEKPLRRRDSTPRPPTSSSGHCLLLHTRISQPVLHAHSVHPTHPPVTPERTNKTIMSARLDPSSDSEPLPAHLDPSTYPQTVHLPDLNIHILLTYAPLHPSTHLSHIRSPSAGANVLFTGTTRNTFADRPVARLAYSCYPALALKTLTDIAGRAVRKYGLLGLSVAHRLGEVGVCEESIVVAVSAGHRGPAWAAGEEVLEECKARVEIWKREEFVGDEKGRGEWRANNETDPEGRKKEG